MKVHVALLLVGGLPKKPEVFADIGAAWRRYTASAFYTGLEPMPAPAVIQPPPVVEPPPEGLEQQLPHGLQLTFGQLRRGRPPQPGHALAAGSWAEAAARRMRAPIRRPFTTCRRKTSWTAMKPAP